MISADKKQNKWRAVLQTYEGSIKIAIYIAIIFHACGLAGMQTDWREWFVSLTPLNLAVMTLLIVSTEFNRDVTFYWFMGLCFAVGMVSEIIGVNTMLLFGDYNYGVLMGPKLIGVPYLIGIQWFVTVYSIGHVTLWLASKVKSWESMPLLFVFFKIILAASITTIFDIILEPAAISLEYWQWLPNGEVPVFNYICWFFISGFLYCPFFMTHTLTSKINYFAISLIVVQALFFLGIGMT